MKLSRIIAFTCCFMLFTCQEEGIETAIEDTAVENVSPEATQRDVKASEMEIFEGRLQWTAFITGKLIIHNAEARRDLTNLLSSSANNTVYLNSLIGALNPNAESFEDGFIKELKEYYRTIRNPEEQRPPIGVSGCCSNNTPEALAAAFIEYMTEDHCVELYFPHNILQAIGGVNDGPTVVSSTAHPLTEDNYNYGFIRHATLQNYPDGQPRYTNQELVDQDYVDSHATIVIARPIRVEFLGCGYREIPVTDFTEFLND